MNNYNKITNSITLNVIPRENFPKKLTDLYSLKEKIKKGSMVYKVITLSASGPIRENFENWFMEIENYSQPNFFVNISKIDEKKTIIY